MYQWRDMMIEGGGAAAMPRGFGRLAPVAVPKVKRFSLVVDLAAEPLSARWWRGAATLVLLCATAGVLAPPIEPLGGTNERPSEAAARHYREVGLAPLAMGGRSGGRMAANDRVIPLLVAPERAQVELDARLSEGDRIEALLMRIGAVPADALTVGRMVHAVAPRGLDGGTAISIRLGQRAGAGLRTVDRIALRAGLDTDLVIERNVGGL
ncbi:MAG: hypothetical protein LH466_07380, partial [Sphingomonas bacterium]|nr:hypothetical protein [Sphingomonas bacterium]